MAVPAIPCIKQIGEPIIDDTGDRMDDGQAKHPPEPAMARGSEPHGDGAVDADMQPPRRIDPMQPATHRLHAGAEAGKRIGLETDVTELDQAGASGTDQPPALPF